jgi:hypothetical protein
MFDVFYSGIKPGLFAHEREADNIEHARSLCRTRYFWWVNYLSDYTGWDFLWEPVPWEQQFTHTWPSQHHEYSGTYLVPTDVDHIEYKFHTKIVPNRDSQQHYHVLVPGAEFDFTWQPHPFDPPYIYVFGNQWWPANKMPTVEYHVPDATERKYMTVAARLPERHTNHWHTVIDCTWNYSWVPDPGDPPYIYVFGNQWHRAEVMPTVEYHVPGATERKYLPFPRAKLLADMSHWSVPDNTNQEAFDFTWLPDPGSPAYIYQFGTQWNRAGGPVYTVPGATEIKYTQAQIARMLPTDLNWTIPEGININSFDFSWTPDSTEQPYKYEFGTQWQKTGGPVYTVPDATETKYINTPRSAKVSRDEFWEIPAGADIESFDWTWHPDDTDPPYIYQFGTQHQRTGGPRYHVPGATETKYVDQIKIVTNSVATAVYEIDHLDGNAGQIPDTYKISRYFDNYLDTLKRIAKSVPDEHEFVWICSSVCDYTDFDFTWHPEQWQATMLHVFPSDGEKFGDTFFMHVPTFLYRSEKCQLLEWYDLNFTDISVPRRPIPVISHIYDSQATAAKSIEFLGPLAVFTTSDRTIDTVPTVPLWREKTKTIVPISTGATSVVVPRAAIPYIKTQLYDYPYIDKTQRTIKDDALDIVFISNGEPNAESNWSRLQRVVKGMPNRLVRIDGINGRVAAYQAALSASNTPWAFCVFAKLSVDFGFDWAWQPDRMQEAKHYIFHAMNPVNSLVYGHMAVIAYNKQLVMENTAPGLDFTLDQAHEVVPMLSGVAYYCDSAWMAWRTAFREVIKLKNSLPDVEAEYRLDKWLTMNSGQSPHSEWSRIGAQDAVEYYDSVGGDFAELRKSYDWAWLSSYAFVKHSLSPD